MLDYVLTTAIQVGSFISNAYSFFKQMYFIYINQVRAKTTYLILSIKVFNYTGCKYLKHTVHATNKLYSNSDTIVARAYVLEIIF
jgi:hypothetical protein